MLNALNAINWIHHYMQTISKIGIFLFLFWLFIFLLIQSNPHQLSFAEKCDICNAKTDCIDSQEKSHSTTTETKTVHKTVSSVSQLTAECALVSKNQLTSPSFASSSKTVITRKPTEDIVEIRGNLSPNWWHNRRYYKWFALTT